MYTKILGYKIFNKSKSELLNEIFEKDKVNIVSGNPEILFNGLEDKSLNENFNSEYSVIIPDGVGTVIASRMVKNPVKEKIAGIEVMKGILYKGANEGKGIYLLGAKEETLQECIKNIKKDIPTINIVGAHNGYFDLDNCDDIVQDIKDKKPWAIFVAMGCPRQENFIINNMDKLPCKIYMGVGGSFDVFAGNVKRAPKWMISLGLEWLYRVSNEPSRIKRLGVIPRFLWRVAKSK
ncbi:MULTISPECIES: WecB/TagA/CpsF family glycosyltransferase [Clostridium]|uniref:N-acetylglucosaminyldiphosphoundecaprenol N-acetyl-beta-D-mannosaminyltransferase n=1 Tax=Clostridium cibarium TaxID=2762247 RepID=A0ABR8PPI4_9CLOT|nr:MULTISPECIES: WecB/TagA/CpsF family glycosyltransferase [Clostridium]MBD7910077.1 WecB/TagA/CpsF family glycosyltransferase [Clostridium cibarium]